MAAYVTYEYYKTIYGESAIPETDFNRLEWEARRKIDSITGNKLKFAFPTDEEDAETVKRCLCKFIEIAKDIEDATKRVSEAQGYVTDEVGTHGKMISSVTSGSESVSYTAKSETGSTVIDAVLSDKGMQDKLYYDTAKGYLYGIRDAKGTHLLYSGL